MFLKISQYSQEKTCVEVFFNKVPGFPPSNFIKKDSNYCEYWEIFKNSFFYRTSPVTASEFIYLIINMTHLYRYAFFVINFVVILFQSPVTNRDRPHLWSHVICGHMWFAVTCHLPSHVIAIISSCRRSRQT